MRRSPRSLILIRFAEFARFNSSYSTDYPKGRRKGSGLCQALLVGAQSLATTEGEIVDNAKTLRHHKQNGKGSPRDQG